MATLPDFLIIELVKTGHLVIDPFNENQVQPASYDLLLGSKVLASPLGPDELGITVELNAKTPSYRIQTGQMVAVISAERLEFPLDICSGGFGIRSEYARKGLIAFGGVQLDPGWQGHITLNLQNVGPEPVIITRNTSLFTVEFHRLEQPASKGYEGRHQYQEDFPDDQYEFILSARTTSLAEIPTLRQQVARLNVLIEELEERLPDPDEGLEVKPEIREALLQSLDSPKDSLLSSEDAWQRFEV